MKEAKNEDIGKHITYLNTKHFFFLLLDEVWTH